MQQDIRYIKPKKVKKNRGKEIEKGSKQKQIQEKQRKSKGEERRTDIARGKEIEEKRWREKDKEKERKDKNRFLKLFIAFIF